MSYLLFHPAVHTAFKQSLHTLGHGGIQGNNEQIHHLYF